ncbi:MAG: Arc family DNA-binding protein [Pseudomonadota bacterium]
MSERRLQLEDKFMLRLPDGLRDKIKAEAKANLRSMNAEILVQLIRAYGGASGPGAAESPAN